MPVDDEPQGSTPTTGPSVRPLGRLAVGSSVVGLVLAASFVLSPLAYLVAVFALLLGGVARSDPHTRSAGTVAMVVSLIAIVVATVLLNLLV